jgi:hypothetical protein
MCNKMVCRATQDMFCMYKLSLLSHKNVQSKFLIIEWTYLNFDQILATRQSHFQMSRNYNLMVDKMLSQIGFNL